MFGITFEVIRLFVGVVMFLFRLAVTLSWAVVVGILALFLNMLRSNPERRMQAQVEAMRISQTKIVSCRICKSDNESSRSFCTTCGSPLMTAMQARSLSDYFRSIWGTIAGAVYKSPAIQKPAGIVLALVLVVTIAVSCSSDRPSGGGQASAPATRVDFEVGVYNAVYVNDGNGWRTGYLTLYYRNISDAAIPPLNLTMTGGTVHTMEDIEYPVSLMHKSLMGDFANYRGMGVDRDFPVSLKTTTPLHIPPQLPFLFISDGGAYILTFRFAAAAHPVGITLDTSFGKYEISFTNLPKTLSVSESNTLSVGTFGDLGAQLSRSTEKMELTFAGECLAGGDSSNRGYGMHYTVRNLDRFNALGSGVEFTYMIYFPDGTYQYYTRKFGSNLGPGMKSEDVWTWASFLNEQEADPVYLITYNSTGQAFIYPGNCREKL